MKQAMQISFRSISIVLIFAAVSLLTSCSEDDNDVNNDNSSIGKTPSEYIDWLDNNGVEYYLDQFGNPYRQGELMIKFDNGYNAQKLNDVIQELAVLNDISPDSIIVNTCGCGGDEFVLLQFEEKLTADLEPAIGSMGDPEGDDDGLTTQTSDGITTVNNYYLTPLPQQLNQAGIQPFNFPPPDEGTGAGYLEDAGSRIVISILDSGFDFDHPELMSYENFRLWRPPVADCYRLGYDFVDHTDVAIDGQGHGTQVAGVILDRLKSYDVPVAIMPLRISDDNGAVSLWDLFCAMNYAVTHGADIVNISAGWYGGPNPIIQKLIEDHPEILFVCSAGNEGQSTDEFPNGHFPSGYTYFPNVIACAALDESNSTLAYFSNYGANSISIAAPGENIITLTPCDGADCGADNRVEVSGTSFSTPYVTAVAAALLSCADIPATEIRWKLYDFGIPNPSLTGKTQSGKQLDIRTIVPLEACEL